MAQLAGGPSRRVLRLICRVALALFPVVSGAAIVVGAASPAGAVSAFTPGDIAVYRVGDGSTTLSGNGAAIFIDEYSPTGTLVQSVPLPTAKSGSNLPIVASGSASSEGLLTLSGDDNYLVATGYDAATGTKSLSSSSSSSVPRTIARVDVNGNVDTTTALTDFSTGNNPRSAVSSNGTNIWVGGAAGGVRFTTLGSTTSTPLNTSDTNVREVSIFGGQLYTSADPTKAGALTIATVGTGEPTTAPQTVTNLPFSAAPTEPYAYSFLTLGSGPGPDTLYVAENTSGSVEKFGLMSGTWTAEGSVSVPNITGLTANDASGTVTIFATSSGSGTSGSLFKVVDASGLGGTLSGTATQIATAGTNEAFRGVAFVPGTTIGSGGGIVTTNPPPTITTPQSGLPAALSDPTNPTLEVDVADSSFTADQLTVAATSSNTTVAPQSGLSITGTGSSRTLTVTPGAVGYSTITLTVTAPDSTTASTAITYGVSANLGDPSDRYFSGAGNGSTAIDVGGGYMIVGDDESNVLRLYNESTSGPPVKTFDFTNVLPFGTTEIDIEAAARAGNTIYWEGSMSNSSDGKLEPARSTVFATQITGSGASTTLTYVGSYKGLQSDLINWDENNGSGLGDNALGFAASASAGVGGHEDDAFNVEGMEFAPGSSSTAYLAFRGPLQPTTDRTEALIVPVTNIDQLVSGGAAHATFGAPIFMNLGGLGIRDLRANADGQYLLIAGTADDSNSSFVLYGWDGNPSDPPIQTGTTLLLIPAGANQGSWETVVSVPDPLSSGSSVQLLEDNGDTAWYGDTLTSKTGVLMDLQKDLGRVFSYSPGTLLSTTTALNSTPNPSAPGTAVTYTAVVSPPAGTIGTPTGTVEFKDAGTDIEGCSAQPLDGCSAQPLDGTGTATCPFTYTGAGSHNVTAIYSGDPSFATSTSSPDNQSVSTTPVTITADNQTITVGSPDPTFTFEVSGLAPSDSLRTPPTCGVVGDHSTVGSYPITCTGAVAPPQYSVGYVAGTLQVQAAASAVALGVDVNPAVTGRPANLTATVAAGAGVTGLGTPTGTVEFEANGVDLPGCSAVILSSGSATCAVPAGLAAGSYQVVALYSGDANFNESDTTATPLTEVVNAASTSLGLSADNNAVVTGQPVTFTAAVSVVAPGASGVVNPSGTVEFQANGIDIAGCSAKPLDPVLLSAQCTATAGFSANAAITAIYSGDTNFLTASATLAESVSKDATSVSVTASPSAPTNGQSLTYTASVVPIGPGAGVPTGTFTFTITASKGAAPACTTSNSVALSGGNAQCVIAANKLVAGVTYTASATYRGDAGFLASTGNLTQTVGRSASVVTVSADSNPAALGASVTFRAVVSGGGSATGTVTFAITSHSGFAVSCKASNTVTLSGGAAQCSVRAGQLLASESAYQVSVAYSGNTTLLAGTGALTEPVVTASTSTQVSTSPAATRTGAALSIKAVVTSSGLASIARTGTVTFAVTGAGGDPVSCTGGNQAELVGRNAFCSIPPGVLRAGDGPYSIRATYSGDGNFQSSTATTSQTVTALATHLGLQSSENPAHPGDQVVLTATLTPTASNGGVVTGTVVFSFAGTNPPSCAGRTTVALANNVASCTITIGGGAAKASYSVGASFGGSADYGASSDTLTEKVAAH